VFQQNNPDNHTMISYHMSWPGSDPYHVYNTTQANVRRDHHSVIWVPWMAVNGAIDLNEASNTTTDWENRILAQADLTSPLGISLGGALEYQGTSICEVSLSPESGVNGTFTLHVVLVEDDLYYMGSNGYPNHHNVMRRMYPDALGTEITLVENTPSVVEVEMAFDLELEMQNCRLVVFVEDASHAVLNVASIHLSDITPINVPYLTVASSDVEVLDQDGNQKLSPGESANFSVNLQNRCGWLEADGITAILSSPDPAVTIDDSVVVYGVLPACSTSANVQDKFSFTIAEDAPRVNEILFELQLTANMDTEVPYQAQQTVVVTMDMNQIHFPANIPFGVVSGSAVVDLNGDGSMEIIFGGMDSMLHVLSSEAQELAGFPVRVDSKITSAPAVGDVDNDGDMEIAAVSVSGGIYLFEADGNGTLLAQAENNILGTPAMDDLDGDGDLEIVTAGFGYDLLVLHHDGPIMAGFPIMIPGEQMEGAAAIADMDGDGSKDIIVGTKGDFLHVFDAAGNVLPGFPVDLGRDIKTAPVITDLTGDGTLEIITGQRSGVVYALSSSGTVLWTHQLAAVPILVPPAVFDFDQNGLMETVYVLPDGRVSVLDHAGQMLEGWPQTLASTCYSAPVMADLDNDGVPEIILGDDSNALYAFHVDGSLVEDFPMLLDARVHCAATIADLDMDGNLEIVAGSDAGMNVIDFPVVSEVGSSWFTSRGNYQRTGYLANPIASGVDQPAMPRDLTLHPNYPNPFNPSTTLRFSLPVAGTTRFVIYDMLGNEVATLVNASLAAGEYSMIWNGQHDSGKPAAAGVYFAHLSVEGHEQIVKMMLLK